MQKPGMPHSFYPDASAFSMSDAEPMNFHERTSVRMADGGPEPCVSPPGSRMPRIQSKLRSSQARTGMSGQILLPHVRAIHVSVHLGGGDIGMAKHLLKGSQLCASLQHVRGEGVP